MKKLAHEGDILVLKHPACKKTRWYCLVVAVMPMPGCPTYYATTNPFSNDRPFLRRSAEHHHIHEIITPATELPSWQALQDNIDMVQEWKAKLAEANEGYEWAQSVRYAHDGQDIIDTVYEIGFSGNMRQRARIKLAELGTRQHELCERVQAEVNEYMNAMEVVA